MTSPLCRLLSFAVLFFTALAFTVLTLLAGPTALAQPPVEALGKRSQTMTGRIAPASPSLGLAWNGDEAGLASLGANGRLTLWHPELGHDVRSRRVVPPSQPAPRSLEEARALGLKIIDDSLLRAMGLSADGGRIALALEGSVSVWNVHSLEGEMRWELPGEELFSITVDSQGGWVASGDGEGRLCLWPMVDGPPAGTAAPGTADRQCTVPVADGSPIVSLMASTEGRLAVGYRHRVEVGRVVEGAWSDAEGWTVLLAAGPPEGEASLTFDERGRVRVVDSLSADNALTSLALSPAGDLLAAGWGDGAIDLLSLGDDSRRFTPPKDEPRLDVAVTALSISPDGQNLLAGGADGSLRLWDLEGNDAPLSLVPRRGESTATIRGVAFDPAGHRVASTDAEGVTRTWARSTGHEIRRFALHGRRTTAVRWANDQELWTVAPSRPAIYAWNVPSDLETVWIEPARLAAISRSGPPTVAIASPTGERVAVGFEDGGVALWQRRTLLEGGRPTAVWTAHDAAVNDLLFEPSPDGTGALLSAGADGRVHRWSDDGSPSPWRFGGKGQAAIDAGAPLRRLVFGPDAKTLALCSELGIELRDLSSGETIATAHGGMAALSISFSNPMAGAADGPALVVAFADGLYDWTPGSEPSIFQQLGRGIRSLDFTPTSGTLASTQSANGAVEIWAFDEQGRPQPRHLLVSGDGDRWLACEHSGTCRRNGDGTLLLSREKDQSYTPMLPVLEITPKLEIVEAPDALALQSGTTTPFTVTVRNAGPGPAPWVTLAPRRSTSDLLFHPPETLTWLAEGREAILEAAITPIGEPRPYLELAAIAAHGEARDGISAEIPEIRILTGSGASTDSLFGGLLPGRVALLVGVVLVVVMLLVAIRRRL